MSACVLVSVLSPTDLDQGNHNSEHTIQSSNNQWGNNNQHKWSQIPNSKVLSLLALSWTFDLKIKDWSPKYTLLRLMKMKKNAKWYTVNSSKHCSCTLQFLSGPIQGMSICQSWAANSTWSRWLWSRGHSPAVSDDSPNQSDSAILYNKHCSDGRRRLAYTVADCLAQPSWLHLNLWFRNKMASKTAKKDSYISESAKLSMRCELSTIRGTISWSLLRFPTSVTRHHRWNIDC